MAKEDNVGKGCGLGFGLVLGIIGACVLLVVLVCGGFLMLGTAASHSARSASQAAPQQQNVVPPTTQPLNTLTAQPTPTVSEWAPGNATVRSGTIDVRIMSVKVGKVPLKQLGQTGSSQDVQLMISLVLKNTSPNKKLNYKSMSGAAFALSRDFATLRDDTGNSYKRIDFGFGTEVAGAVSSESIYPGKEVTDVLVFEPPIDVAKHLDLEMPAKNFGGEGMVRFRIPAEMIGR